VPKKLSFEKFDQRGIPLAEVIAVHRQFRAHSRLIDNLGDGFLCATNPVFRSVREEFLARGFSFTEKNLNGYFAFPLMSLDEAIDSRQVPYRENFLWLEKLEKSAPGTFTLTELKRSELKFNYLFHEAAHCIAHDLFFGKKSIRRAPKSSDTLLKIFLGEAFANSVEALASAFAEGEIGGYFLDANCHFRANGKEVGILQKSLARLGAEATALALIGSFLYSNYLFESLSQKQYARISSLAGASIPRSLVKIGLQLNEEFRTSTTPLHLVKTGFPMDLGRLMQADPVEAILRSPKLERKVRELARIAGRGAEP
jgi:hypothetical protein